MEMRFRRRIFPHLGKAEIGSVKPSTVRSWDRLLRDEGLSDRYRHTLFGNLSAMFTAAIDDGLTGKHPCTGKSVKKPKPIKSKVVPWPENQVWEVQEQLPQKFQILVDFCAGLGLRQGNASAWRSKTLTSYGAL